MLAGQAKGFSRALLQEPATCSQCVHVGMHTAYIQQQHGPTLHIHLPYCWAMLAFGKAGAVAVTANTERGDRLSAASAKADYFDTGPSAAAASTPPNGAMLLEEGQGGPGLSEYASTLSMLCCTIGANLELAQLLRHLQRYQFRPRVHAAGRRPVWQASSARRRSRTHHYDEPPESPPM